ncbi:unnamed protein product [Psylliodes chrysocephalus]|uniref:Uncharacterized protein n=1 Tax=Psylliodes chrysocephalus TaxID=3402493 RepID=A0A9P0G4L4_9CUCU|nr:unnamed protein product [Psylliodes chrysocephala]
MRDRDRIYRGRDRYGDRDRYFDPYESDRGYEPYDRYDRYGGGRDRTYYDPYERNNDRGIGYDNRGYDYRGYDNRYDTYPYRSNEDTYRGYSPGGRDYGTSGYASRWNYGNSGSGRDDYYNRDR